MPEFRRPPRIRRVVEPVEVALPSPPNIVRPNRRPPIGQALMMVIVPALLPAVGFGAVALFTNAPIETILPMGGMMVSMAMAVGITTTMTRRDEDARLELEQREHDAEMEAFEDAVSAATAEAERLVRREASIYETDFPSPADLLRSTTAVAPSTWERRPGDEDFLELRVGTGRRRSCLKFGSQAGRDEFSLPIVERLTWHESLPVTVRFEAGRRAGLFGTSETVNGLLSWLVFQAATLHAPWDLSVVVLSRNEELCAWAKWLPHCSLKMKSNFKSLVARVGSESVEALRAVADDLQSGANAGPRYLVIADGRGWPTLERQVERWLPKDSARVSLLVVQNRFAELTGECDFVVDLTGSLGRIQKRREDGESPVFVTDAIYASDASRGASALASIEVAAGERHTPIPPTARLGDVLGGSVANAQAIEQTWQATRQRFSLAAPIGIGPDEGTVEIDLRRDGPHGLLAGTTGSGKSEFLQSLVVSLAARVPPDLLNFVLIDYKGGSAFREVADLPHVVGVVTDLDERLALRALTSLRAEMKRREELLASVQPAAANIIDYQAQARRVPLANLVIIIDEFHRLVSEQPDFIDEMVQIAQQGRSLGIHLLLATQKPSGVITDHIRANTNLRICLRVTDEADSRDVLGGPEAANIPRDLPGRVYIRVGNEALRVAQAGRVSGMVPSRDRRQSAIEVRPFLPPLTPPSFQRGSLLVQTMTTASPFVEEDPLADIDLIDERATLIEAIRAAALRAGVPEQAPPWQPHLPDSIQLSDLTAAPSADGSITIGLLDEPELQRQQLYALDLDGGHVCIAGGSNTGKTTALMTIAAAAAAKWSPNQLHIYGLDFAGGDMLPLQDLPHCGGVALQHDAASVHWVLQALRDFVAERLRQVATTAGDASAFPRILVVIDNFSAMYTAIQNSEEGQDAADDLAQVMDLGRSVGVTFVISVERPEALRAAVVALLQTRLILDLSDPTGYAVFGLNGIKRGSAIAGRAIMPGRFVHEVQIADAGETLAGLRKPATAAEDGPLRIAPLPAEMGYERLHESYAAGLGLPGLLLGLAEGTRPLFVHPRGAHLIVIGPRRSGRSNTLATATLEVQRLQATKTYMINPRRSPALRETASAIEMEKMGGYYAERLPDVESMFAEITNEVAARQKDYVEGKETFEPWVVVVDDVDVLEIPPSANDALQVLALRGADLGAVLLFAADSQALRSSYPSGVTRALLNQRTGILLAPTTPEDFDYFGVRGKPGRLPPGRGFYCAAAAKHAIQVALAPQGDGGA